MRAATANHIFKQRSQKSNKDNDLSALKQFASDQLTLISQKEYASQMHYMDQFDDMNSRQRISKGRSIQKINSNREGRMGVQQEDKNRTRSVYAQSKQSAKEKLQQQFFQSSNGFRKNNERGATSQLKRFGKQTCEDDESNDERPYDKNIAKQKLCRAIRDRLRKELWYMYRSAEQAYGSFDFSGLGYITEQVFLDSKLVQNRVPYSNDEIRLFFRESNLFDKSKKGLEFDTFKKYFFPHLYLVQDDADDAEDKAAFKTKQQLKMNSGKQPQVIEDRVIRLESKLKTKFSNCFESVRKAFLALDSDYDGIITVEDILKYFGNETDLNYNDLKKLINDKDSKKQGKLGYMDFSKWLGNAIHMSEGFYFRHDSVKNPQYEGFLEKDALNKAEDKKCAQRALMVGDIEAKILEKIKFQWKTLRKAFMDLNIEKTGRISRREFKFYLNFWGMDITDEEFEAVYNKFDLDQDGVISYKDFQISIGSEMFPAEGLYFRQDKPQQCKTNVCQHPECWQPTKSNQNFCVLHQKMHQDEAIQIYTKIFKNLGSSWTKFIDAIKKNADSDDESQIVFTKFCKLCDQFSANISSKDKRYLLEAFPGKEGGADSGEVINVARIYDQKYSIILGKMYTKVDVQDFEAADEPMDPNGYLGKTKFYRPQQKTLPISQDEFLNIFAQNDRLKDIMRTINEIDKDHNGYVTATELDDILKLYYPDQFNDRELIPHIKKFSSIQNRILIDYKEFRDWLKLNISNINGAQSGKDSKSNKLREKIQSLENRVKSMKHREAKLEKNLREYSDVYYSNNDNNSMGVHSRRKSLTSQNRAKSCISGQRPRQDNASAIYNKNQSKSKSNLLSEANLKRSMMSPRAKSGGKSHRPSTSGVGSRKMSISKRDRDVDSKGYTIDIQNYFDKENGKKTNQSESKFVSINQLMKHNNQGASRLNQTLHYKGSEDELNDEQYQTLQTFQGGRSTTQLQTYKPGYNNFDERTKNLKYFKDGQQLNLKSEDDLIKGRLRNIQPTDDRTMNKILNFAQTINQKIDPDSSPERKPALNKSHNISYSNNKLNSVSPGLFRTAEYSHRRPNQDSQSRLGLSDSKYSANKSVFSRTKFEKLMIHKLGYEWKNIYRTLTLLDPENLHVVTMNEFSQACDKNKVSILKQELQKLQKLYGAESFDFDVEGVIEPDQLADFINYKRLSVQLGLHKDSYNYLNSVQNQQRQKNVSKLRNLYKSIESPTARLHTEEIDKSFMMASAPNTKGRSLMTRNNNHKSAAGLKHESHNEMFDKREMQSPYSNALNRGLRSVVSKKQLKEESNLILSAHPQRTVSTEQRKKLGARYIVNDPFKNENQAFRKTEEEMYKINLKDQVKFMSKRHSYNGKQKEVLNRLAEQGASNQSNKTTDVTDGHLENERKSNLGSSMYDESIKTNVDDAHISRILQDKQKLKQFRDLVIIQLKKNDIQQKIIANEFQTNNNSDIVLPKSNFKQCLQAIGVHLSHDQMQRFVVRAEVSLKSTLKVIPETAQEHKESGLYEKSGRNKLNKSQAGYRQSSVKVRSLVNDAGPKSLGYNVQKFIQYYLN